VVDFRDFDWKIILVVAFALAFTLSLSMPAFSTAVSAGTHYEGPVQEFVAVEFDGQKGHTGWTPLTIDGVYSSGQQPEHASVWSWVDPNNVEIDPDGAARGCPNLIFYSSPYTIINKNGEPASNNHVIRTIEYDIVHNGKTYRVQQYLTYFRTYVKFTSTGRFDATGIHVDEIDWSVACDVYVHLGINKWGSRAEADHLWAGILQVEVFKVDKNNAYGQKSIVAPASASGLTMLRDVKGSQLTNLRFDSFGAGWQNPDDVPSDVYYKLRVSDFQVGKELTVGKLLEPEALLEVWTSVIISHRWILNKENEAKYEDQYPNMGYDYFWEQWISDLLDTFGLDPTLLLIAIVGLIVLVLLIVGAIITSIFGLIILLEVLR
jgi:hypothetical protein